jgi:hypothetical protein
MTSIIKVDQIQTASGAAPTAAGLGLNVSGSVVGSSSNYNGSAYTYTSTAAFHWVTTSIVAKYSSAESDFFLSGSLAHGLGPANTNLDQYGMVCGFRMNDTTMNVAAYADVFAGSGSGVGYGPEWDIRTVSLTYKTNGQTWSAGDTINFSIYANCDGNGSIYINRCQAYATARATTAITVLEVKK